MIKSLTLKVKNLFKKKKSPIPFTEFSQVQKTEEKSRPSKPQKKQKPVIKEKNTPVKPDIKTTKTVKKSPVTKNPVKKKKPWSESQFPVPVEEGKIRFHDLKLSSSIMHAIADLDFKYCTPIQAGILPDALSGKDAIGKAQTGTGKSAAFIITIISHLQRNPIKGGPKNGFPRSLILAPTRELVVQIEKDILQFIKYTPFKAISLFGGMGYEKQKQLLKQKSFDIVVATPGRLIDFSYQKLINLGRVEILILDEADRMLDMGFIPDVRKIVYKTPHKDKRQTMFYSATFSPEVSRLAEQWTTDSVTVDIEPENIASKSIKQLIYLATSDEKFTLLYNSLDKYNVTKALIFTNRRDEARDLNSKLETYGISTGILTGEVHQKKRMSTLEKFRNGDIRVLVATDVAGRGIHIDSISHVINYHLPQDPENYVHRIGRTGRAGESGISISFACEDDSFSIPAIEEYLGDKLQCEHPDDELLKELPEPKFKPSKVSSNKKPKSGNYKNRNQNKNNYNKNNRGNSQRGKNTRGPQNKTQTTKQFKKSD